MTPFLTFGAIKEFNVNIIEDLRKIAKESPTIKNNKKIEYYNIPAAYDIETSSFYLKSSGQPEKCAIMYEWTVGVYDTIIVGRTWDDFITLMKYIVEAFDLSENKRLCIYVHNLSYEFQFICKRMEWKKVFAIKTRKPVYALTVEGIEFRCSYILSGKPLRKLHEELQRYVVKKSDGDLDYNKIRHHNTPLTEKEWGYCINDVRVVLSYIMEKIENEGGVHKIPLTKTGYVRNYCRDSCYYDKENRKNKKKYYDYRRLMENLVLTPEEYEQLKRAFQGGFTHANAWYSGRVVNNVRSFDFTSSYPYVMLSEKFPMSRGEIVTPTSPEQFKQYMKTHCCLLDVTFYNIEPLGIMEHPISYSRCRRANNVVIDNGRVVSADTITTTITEQDYMIFRKFYTWKHMELLKMRVYKKGYLPTDFVKSILKLYQDKTTLKGVKGRELDYLLSKEKINSAYGMCVTDIARDDDTYTGGEWITTKADLEKSIGQYNKSRRRFLSYAWGVWVTAYARRNLFTGISEFGTDYIYSDTDSIKVINAERHADYFVRYNEVVSEKLRRAAEFHGLNPDDFAPRTIKGIAKPLGVWDDEGVYDKFKTLGAKRYMVLKDGELSITVSGVNKEVAVPWIESQGNDPFSLFSDSLHIPAGFTGKNTHTYIDEERRGVVVDYMGVPAEFHELTAIHMEATDYTMSLSAQYVDYLRGLRDEISG